MNVYCSAFIEKDKIFSQSSAFFINDNAYSPTPLSEKQLYTKTNITVRAFTVLTRFDSVRLVHVSKNKIIFESDSF
jgi:hypothetical protein